jgi:hypothetical protein
MTEQPNNKLGAPTPPQSTAADIHCSFCHKSRAEVRKIIAGPSVFICDECVELCDDLIAEHSEAHFPVERVRVNAGTASCSLCRLPKDVRDLRMIEERGLLCLECIAATRRVGEGIDATDRAT